MRKLLVNIAFWLLRIAGESPRPDQLTIHHSIADIRDAEVRLARVRARLEMIDAQIANYVHHEHDRDST